MHIFVYKLVIILDIHVHTIGDALRKSVQQFTSKHSSVESGFELEDDTVVPQMVSAGNDTIAQCSVDTRNGGLQEVLVCIIAEYRYLFILALCRFLLIFFVF